MLDYMQPHYCKAVTRSDTPNKTGANLTMLVQGVCSRGGAILMQGSYWGDAIVASPALRDSRDAKALSYCEIARVSREALVRTMKHYPTSAKHLHELWSMYLIYFVDFRYVL